MKESNQASALSSQRKQRNITPPDLPLPQVEEKKREEKFSKAIDDIETILKDVDRAEQAPPYNVHNI